MNDDELNKFKEILKIKFQKYTFLSNIFNLFLNNNQFNILYLNLINYPENLEINLIEIFENLIKLNKIKLINNFINFTFPNYFLNFINEKDKLNNYNFIIKFKNSNY